MQLDKFHYYDGKLYEKISDPLLEKIRNIISSQIESGSSVIDLGCGTGALVFNLSKICKSVIGVELSSRMIAFAEKKKKFNYIKNVYFIHSDATNLSQFKKHQFDYAVISMVLHEALPKLRSGIINEAKRIAKKIIIADYSVPQPFNLEGIFIFIIEFLAGISHFKGFRSFQKNNGIDQILSDCHLSIGNEIKNKNGTIRIVTVK